MAIGNILAKLALQEQALVLPHSIVKRCGVVFMPDLANAMKTNPQLKVMLNAGYYDLATPFFAATYEEHHLPIDPSLTKNIEYDYYKSGHMVYVRDESLHQLHDNAAAFIRRTENRPKRLRLELRSFPAETATLRRWSFDRAWRVRVELFVADSAPVNVSHPGNFWLPPIGSGPVAEDGPFDPEPFIAPVCRTEHRRFESFALPFASTPRYTKGVSPNAFRLRRTT